MSGQDFVDAARNAGPNATIRIAGPGGVRFGVMDSAASLVRDWDALRADAARWKADAEKWQGIALKLADIHASEEN